MTPRQGGAGALWKDDPEVGRRIATLRVDHGWTSRELAERVGLNNGYISHIENGRRTPSLAVMVEIALALGTTVLFLVNGDPTGLCPFCGRNH